MHRGGDAGYREQQPFQAGYLVPPPPPWPLQSGVKCHALTKRRVLTKHLTFYFCWFMIHGCEGGYEDRQLRTLFFMPQSGAGAVQLGSHGPDLIFAGLFKGGLP